MILRLCSVAADSGRMIECENHSPQQPPWEEYIPPTMPPMRYRLGPEQWEMYATGGSGNPMIKIFDAPDVVLDSLRLACEGLEALEKMRHFFEWTLTRSEESYERDSRFGQRAESKSNDMR
ncbi:hypothetical protein Tco_0990666 [Tanacetum coccineum]|uniref:Uncharacterized protein n=1 Tax=Tanacetum coccineum TaxID=301880 RepID=A0ABQ5EYG4_9ASTR